MKFAKFKMSLWKKHKLVRCIGAFASITPNCVWKIKDVKSIK